MHTRDMQTVEIQIDEDNSGAVYLTRGDETWGLGPVTRDMYGTALECVQAWRDGEWEPNEHDGQHRADTEDLDLIATLTPAGLTVELDAMGEPVAGAGGHLFRGIEALA